MTDRMKRTLLTIAIASLALAGCSSEEPSKAAETTEETVAATTTPADPNALSENDYASCTDLAEWIQDGKTGDRVELSRLINGKIRGSANQNLVAAGEGMARTADGSESAWTMATDVYAQACFDSGWNG